MSNTTWRIGGSTLVVITVTGFESGKVEFVVDEKGQGMFEGAGDELSLEVYRQQLQPFVNRLETRHGFPFSLRHDFVKL